jgi:hypothetical protein
MKKNTSSSLRGSTEIKETRSGRKYESIKKDLYKLNKNFLEDFKSYQILKFNILKNKEEINNVTSP